MRRKKVWKRVLGILLAGVLTVENCMVSLAASPTVVQTDTIEMSNEAETEYIADVSSVEDISAGEELLVMEQETEAVSTIELEVEERTATEQETVVQETLGTETSATETDTLVEESATEEVTESMTEIISEEIATEEKSVETRTETVQETLEETTEMTEVSDEEQSTVCVESVEEETTTEEASVQESTNIQEEQQVYEVQEASEEIQLELFVPKNLEITEKTEDSITLQWDTILGCTEYLIYRSETEEEGYEQLAEGKVSTDSNRGAYTDNTCEEGKIYYYKVQGYMELSMGTTVYSGFSNIVNNRIALEGITLDKTECEIVLGETDLVTVLLTPENTTDQEEISYSISDEEVVAVDLIDESTKTVTICANQVGEADVTIQVGDYTATCHVVVVADAQHNTQVEVVPVQEVVIEATLNDDVEEGVLGVVNLVMGNDEKSSATLKATVLPEDATNKVLKWTSSDSDVVTVSESDGVVTAVGVGTAVITATAENGISDKVTVVVLPVEQEFRIKNGTDIQLYCNETLPQAENMESEHQIELNKNLTYTYQSSKADIASVNEAGVITAHAPGTATITIRAKETGKLASMTVTVRRCVEEVKVPKDEITVMRGTMPKIAFTVVPQNVSAECLNTLSVESSRKILSAITWTKKKTSGEIIFRADKVGTAKLIITAGDNVEDEDGEPVNSVCKEITVHVVEPSAVKVGSAKLSGTAKMKSGTVQQLELSVLDNTRHELDIEEIGLTVGYTSSNEAVATVDEQGKVTALTGGRAIITAYILDGSNKKVTFTVVVEQRPEEITFEKETYHVSKATNAAANITLKPIFVPVSTASAYKGVQWEIVEIRNADDTLVEGAVSNYATINASGTVTLKKTATDGMYVIVRCTSKAYDNTEKAVSADVKIVIQSKKVSALRFKTTNIQMIGLAEMNLPFIPTFVKGCNEAEFEAMSSNAEIVEVLGVENDVVKLHAKAYGTVTITLFADHAVKANCRITVYPFVRGALRAKESSYTLQQAQYDATDKVEIRFVDAKTQQIEVNPQLFTYQSSNPDIVYVDENGVAYANPKSDGKITTKNNQVTITATLKDDPDRRKVTAKVIVCPTEQIERMDVTYYRTTKLANLDTSYSEGTTLTDQGTTLVYDASSRNFVLRVFAYGADYEAVKIPKIKATTSDSTIAMITSFRLKQTSGMDVWEAVVSVKKPGRFKVIFTAQDQKKISREIMFGVYSGNPILESANLGCINKHLEAIQINQANGIASEETFTLIGTDGTEIKEVSVKSAQIKIKENGKAILKTYDCEEEDYFRVESLGNQKYRLIIYKDILENAIDGNYKITLNVKRSSLPGDVGFGSDKVKTITSTYKIASTLPKIANATVTLNSFIKGDAVEIPLKTTEPITSVSVASGMMMDNEVDIFMQDHKWYVKLKDEKFENWKKSSTSGKLEVALEGYETPIQMNLTVRTTAQKPIVRQLSIPSVQLEHSGVAYVTLVDNKKEVWSGLEVTCKNGEKSVYTTEVLEDNRVQITFRDTEMKLRGQGATYTEKIVVTKPEWKTPIELAISVKAYNGTSIPQIKFAKSTLNLNKYVGETEVETDVICSMDNVELTTGEWKIVDTCKFRTTVNKKTVWYPCSEVFQTIYQNGKLKIVLKNPDLVPKGTYKLIMTQVWDEKNEEGLKSPLKTSAISVVVRDVKPTVRIQMSGKLDLISRSNSTLKGKITVSNVNSTVRRVKLVNTNNDGFADKFYCIRSGQEFTIYARSNAALTTTTMKGTIEITMSDGTVLSQVISFRPTQSTPRVANIANQNIYKSAKKQSTDFDFNKILQTGVYIQKVEAVKVPKGITVEESNGHLLVSLEDKTLKAGKYLITVKLYFKGAQAIKGSELGQAITKNVYVEVKE